MTVLGKSPAWADAGGACSGYLVESGDTSVLLDCGPGVLGKLRALHDYASIDAVVISHLHADHMLDIVPFASALIYGPRWATADRDARPHPALYAPPGSADAFTVVAEGSGMFGNHVADAFDLREYDPAETLEIGPLRVRFRPVPHFIPAQAVEIAEGERRLTFSSDCGPNSELCDFARDTDLLLIEAAVTEADAARGGERGHLTPREAGEHGRRAGARRVVLTHVSDELDPATVLAQGTEGYGAEVELAAEHAAYEI